MNKNTSENQPLVSVVITCYNYGQYLDEAVDSVLSQTYQNIELIIVNDGSTDDFTNKLLADYQRPKTKVITTPNQGLPGARNTGIKLTKGEYICNLDADDKYSNEFIEKCLNQFLTSEDKNLGIVTTWVKTFGAKEEIWEMGEFDPTKLLMDNDGGIHVASMLKRKIWEELNGYDEKLRYGGFEDRNFWIGAAARGYTWECIKEPLFNYRVKETSMIDKALEKKKELFGIVIDNNREFYEQNILNIILRHQEKEQMYRKRIDELNGEVVHLKSTASRRSVQFLLKLLKAIGRN